MFLLLDNYDSFTWNLYQAMSSSIASSIAGSIAGKNEAALEDAQNAVKVIRNDKISVEMALDMQPRGIVISPGPGRPEEAGISLELIDALLQAKQQPALLGVCLGMQCLAQSCGAKVVRAKKLMHGKTSQIKIASINKENGENGNSSEKNPLFLGLPETLKATRYHSLVVEPNSVPPVLSIDAYSEDEENSSEPIVMALSHKKLDLFGVQFHPESIACEHGWQLIDNFITFCLNRR